MHFTADQDTQAILAQGSSRRCSRTSAVSLFLSLLHFGKTWSCSHAAQRLDSSSGRVGTDPPRSSSRESKMAFSKGESPATRAGFGTSRGAPRPLEARTSVCWSAQSAPSTFVARGIPCRSYATTKVARLQAALLTLEPEDFVEKAALEASLQKAQVQATAPPVAEQVKQTTQGASQALPSGSSGPRIGILNVRRSWPKQKNVWCRRFNRWKKLS